MHIHLILVFFTLILKTLAVQTRSEANSDSLPSLNNENDNSAFLKPFKQKRKRIRPPGDQSYQSLHSKKIVQLLKKKGNGVKNYQKAKEKADEYIEKLHQSAKLRVEKKRELDRKIGKPQRPKGYCTVDNKIKRKTRLLMKKDKSLNECEAKRIAEEEHLMYNEKHKVAQRNSRMLKEKKTFEQA